MDQRPATGPLVHSHIRHRVCELVVNIDVRLEGDISHWPSNIQDGIYKALADRSHKSRRDFKIITSYSDTDIDTGPYIHVIAVALENMQ